MKPDSDILHALLIKTPDDLTLLSAYCDALQEENRQVRADRVRCLLDARREWLEERASWDGTQHPGFHRLWSLEKEIFRLERLLLIRPIQVGDFLTNDEDGRLVPCSAFSEGVHQIVGTVERVGPEGVLDVKLAGTGLWGGRMSIEI